MPRSDGDEELTTHTAAEMLGVTVVTVRRLVEAGELGQVRTYGTRANGRPSRRRSFELTRKDVEEFLDRTRVKPGELSHLYPTADDA